MAERRKARRAGTWQGRSRTSAKVGAPVNVGGYAVPRRVTFEFEGTDGKPGNVSPDVTAHFEVRDGVPECVEISVCAKADGRAVRTADLALFNVENLTKRVFAEHAVAVETGELPTEQQAASRAITDRVEGPRPAREAELEAVARVYLTHRPTGSAAVRDLLDYPDRTAYRRVEQARQRGLIPAQDASDAEYAAALQALERPKRKRAPNAVPIAEMNAWLGWKDRDDGER